MNKMILLVALAGLFAVSASAQNCAASNTCKVDQSSNVKVIAQNGDDFCYFVQDVPESVQITCTVKNVVKLTTKLNFWAGECIGGNFGGTEFQWSLCRTPHSTTIFSWDVTAGNLEKTGTLF